MDQGQQPADETLVYLLSLTDAPPQGPAWDSILAQVHGASTASLFVLSRRAQSSEVRREAAAALNSRLHEPGDGGSEKPSSDVVSQGELPPELATHRHFYKFSEGEQWVLATRSGVRVAAFRSEAELDQWWRGLRKQRGASSLRSENPRRDCHLISESYQGGTAMGATGSASAFPPRNTGRASGTQPTNPGLTERQGTYRTGPICGGRLVSTGWIAPLGRSAARMREGKPRA